MIEQLLEGTGLFILAASAFSDLRTREVPDWLSYAALFSGLGIRLISSVATFNLRPIVQGFTGVIVFAILSLLMYRFGQWGGGDVKLLIGLGSLIGFAPSLESKAVAFFINLIFVGAAYGLLWVFILAVKNWGKVKNQAARMMKKGVYKNFRFVTIAFSVMLLLIAIVLAESALWLIAAAAALLVLSLFYLSLVVGAVETSCLLKWLPPEKLTEGDWIVKDVIFRGKKIAGPAELGISRRKIMLLIKLKQKGLLGKNFRVLVKEGIPFVPSFLIAYIAALLFGNFIFLLF
ncbi:MAG: A24 family peptidase [Candidatus Woesearchaeota archaeon]